MCCAFANYDRSQQFAAAQHILLTCELIILYIFPRNSKKHFSFSVGAHSICIMPNCTYDWDHAIMRMRAMPQQNNHCRFESIIQVDLNTNGSTDAFIGTSAQYVTVPEERDKLSKKTSFEFLVGSYTTFRPLSNASCRKSLTAKMTEI